MISRLSIQNFRSIQNLQITFQPVNALVGSNNAGKSNIMKALNLVLGSSWPGVRSFEDQDFYDYNTSNQIAIVVIFDAPLLSDPSVWGFRLTFDGNNCDFFATDQTGGVRTYPRGQPIRVSNAMKDEVSLMYLGLDREASQQLRATQWTLYGRLLKYIGNTIPPPTKQAFTNDIQASYNTNIAAHIATLESILKGHVKSQTGLDLHLRMKLFDPVDTIKNLRPYLSEPNSAIEFDAEDVGAGTQSALAVAIARAYGEIVRRPLVLAVEEPELYLHPHGCRNFYKILRDLSANGVQVIYTTHDRCFVDISHFEELHHVKKDTGQTLVHSGAVGTGAPHPQLAVISKFDDNVNEVFFAHHAILVEGPTDRIACREALEVLGLELDKQSVSVIDCTSINNINPIAEILRVLRIPVYALVDEDPGNANTAATIAELRHAIGIQNVFLQSPNLETLFGLPGKPSKADALRIFPAWFSTNTPQTVYQTLKQTISS